MMLEMVRKIRFFVFFSCFFCTSVFGGELVKTAHTSNFMRAPSEIQTYIINLIYEKIKIQNIKPMLEQRTTCMLWNNVVEKHSMFIKRYENHIRNDIVYNRYDDKKVTNKVAYEILYKKHFPCFVNSNFSKNLGLFKILSTNFYDRLCYQTIVSSLYSYYNKATMEHIVSVLKIYYKPSGKEFFESLKKIIHENHVFKIIFNEHLSFSYNFIKATCDTFIDKNLISVHLPSLKFIAEGKNKSDFLNFFDQLLENEKIKTIQLSSRSCLTYLTDFLHNEKLFFS